MCRGKDLILYIYILFLNVTYEEKNYLLSMHLCQADGTAVPSWWHKSADSMTLNGSCTLFTENAGFFLP
ncbi:hypothetical protein D0T85_03140 [Bacteroides sp. 519]|nr:hypothetical protein [Bacteroides sp. 519]